MKRTLRLTTLVFCISLILVSWSNAGLARSVADEPVVEPDFGATAITWNAPQGSGGFVLVVSGPNGYRSEQSFDSTAQPAFEIVDPSGLPLADGLYQYELRPISVGTAQSRSGGDDGRDPAIARQLAGSQTHSSLNIDTVSGVFTIQNGAILDPNAIEEETSAVAQPQQNASPSSIDAPADVVHPDDVIIQGSLCVGFDCVNNESFGFDTIRLKENNTRIKFEDTSSGSFPTVDWQLTANDSASGGASKFSIEDITNAKVPFTVIAAAPTNSFYMDSSGRVGLGTASPVLNMHVATGNTPAMRLEQNSTSGFTAQTWDVASNEANFFVRDVTGGSRLPFRIRPGAPTSSLDIAASGNVGVGTASPSASLHVRRTDGTAKILVEEASTTAAPRTLMSLNNNGGIFFTLENTTDSLTAVTLGTLAGDFRVLYQGGTPALPFKIDSSGNGTFAGTLTTSGATCGGGCRSAGTELSTDVLSRISDLPIIEWSDRETVVSDAMSIGEDLTVRRVSPDMLAFYELYGFGVDGKSVAPLDVATVALAASKALAAQAQSHEAELVQLHEENVALQSRVDSLEAAIKRLESMAHTHAYLPTVVAGE